MTTQHKFFTPWLLILLGLLVLIACTPTTTQHTAPPTEAAEPTNPLTVVQAYYEAIEASDLDKAMTFVTDDYMMTDPSGYTRGKEASTIAWQSYFDAGFTFDQSDFKAVGNRVTSCFKVYQNGTLIDEGCGAVTHVRDGKITFDGLVMAEAQYIVEEYYAALNEKDIDLAMSFIAPNAEFANPTGKYTTTEEIRASLDGLAKDGIMFELTNFRATEGRVVYDYKVLMGTDLLDSGTDGLTIVQDGLIVFDGTERTASGAGATSDTPALDPITVVQNYWEAFVAEDLDAITALLADDVRWRGTPYLTGKTSVLSYIQGDINSDFTYELSDMRATKGRVTYTWAAYRNDAFQVRGEDTMVVESGKIVAIESHAVMGDDTRPPIVEVAFTASDSAFTGPTEIAGGWVKLVLTNEGQEPHHIQLVKLFDGKTANDLTTALSVDPENFPTWSQPYGGPNAPDPGGVTSAIVFLDAGTYALIDVIPNAEGVLHFMTGLITTLTVTEPKGIISGEPLADITINLTEFAFLVSGELTPGEHIIRFNNAGKQVHEAVLVKLNNGATTDDYLNTPPGEVPPAVSIGGVTGLIPGDGQYIPVTLEAGEYALFCFFPDPGTHAPHFIQGMVLQFTVK